LGYVQVRHLPSRIREGGHGEEWTALAVQALHGSRQVPLPVGDEQRRAGG